LGKSAVFVDWAGFVDFWLSRIGYILNPVV
jgi:hypothetical protein